MSRVVLGSEPAMGPESGMGAIGTWRMVAAVIDGKDLPVGRSTVMEVTSEGFTIKLNGRVYQRGTARAVSGHSPREVDVTVTEGKDAGTTFAQISQVDGNVLIGCRARTGAPRPTSFESTPDGGQALSVWLRDEEALRLSTRPAIAGQWYAILPVLFVADDVNSYLGSLEPSLGRWGGLVAIGLALAAIQLLFCLLLRWGWRSGIVCGVSIALFLLVDKELGRAIEPALGHSGSVIVAISTSAVAGLLAWRITSRLLKVNY